jgi:Xaa-Pro dipeptidase
MIHALARPRTIGAGDVVLLELAGVCNRYHAVLMRTAVVGRPSPRVRATAECLEEAMAAAIAACTPGADAAAPDRACNAVLARHDLVRRRAHRIGYSLGIAYPPTWLEPMVLAEGDPHRIQPGMSFTLEPNLYLPDEGFGMKLGETVVCTAEGPESLSSLDHGLIVVD